MYPPSFLFTLDIFTQSKIQAYYGKTLNVYAKTFSLSRSILFIFSDSNKTKRAIIFVIKI